METLPEVRKGPLREKTRRIKSLQHGSADAPEG
jgi:hypothetical protein